jgi:predicted metal-binding membrane protein
MAAGVTPGVLAALCTAIPQGQIVVPAVLHASAWVLMITAMMLPTTFPVLQVFRRIVAQRPDPGCSRSRRPGLPCGVDGVRPASARRGRVVAGTGAPRRRLIAYGWVIGAAVLAGAGLFQFSALKYRCLEQCHTPFGFVIARWHGRSASREAFRLASIMACSASVLLGADAASCSSWAWAAWDGCSCWPPSWPRKKICLGDAVCVRPWDWV